MEYGDKFGFIETVRFLSKYIKKYKKNLIRFYIGMFFQAISTILLPALFGIMIDESVYHRNVQSFIQVSIMVGVVALLSTGLFFLIYSQQHYIYTMVSFDVKQDIFSQLMKCNMYYLLSQDSGELVNMLSYYPGECVNFIVRGIIHQINRIISIVILNISLFQINFAIGIIVSISSILIYVMSLLCGNNVKKYALRYRKYYDKFISWIYEMLDCKLHLHVLNSFQFINKKFKNMHRDLFREQNTMNYVKTAADGITGFLNLSTMVLIYVFATRIEHNEGLSIGVFTVIISYFNIMKKKIVEFSQAYMQTAERIAIIKKMYDFLHIESEDVWPGKDDLCIDYGKIEFKNVTFGYPQKQKVLINSSFQIMSNEKVAIVGESGIGKSTLAHLLVGMFQPDEGEILIDGKNLLSYSLKSLRKQIGILEQDIFLFQETIRYNLLIGNLKATQEEIELACEKAGILSFIQSLEHGFDTIIGKSGATLSGGQKQRIGIARLYLRNTKIIILDEATSSLDDKTEKEIVSYWNNKIEDTTVLIISHKLSAIEICKRAIMLDNEHHTIEGSLEQLKENDERFRTLFRLG